MKDCDNSTRKIHISNNFVLSISLLIMLHDTGSCRGLNYKRKIWQRGSVNGEDVWKPAPFVIHVCIISSQRLSVLRVLISCIN